MHHIEYLCAAQVDVKAAHDRAMQSLLFAGYRLGGRAAEARRSVALSTWPWEARSGARLLLPRGFDLGDEVALHLAHDLGAPTLRLFAAAGAEWGYDAFSPGGARVAEFRGSRPRRGDEGARLALWSGVGTRLARAIDPILSPTSGEEGPAAIAALAEALGAPYPTGDELETPALRAHLNREDP